MTAKTGTDAPPRLRYLTDAALLLAVCLMMTRATMLEFVRDPFSVSAISGPGAATTVMLDALAWLPALLVLLRRAVDRSFSLRQNTAWLIAFGLAAWAACSVAWASDRFIAAVSASTCAAAVATAWAVTQCVRDAARLRVVAAGACGVLIVLLAQGSLQRFVEFPETLQYWETHREEFFAKQGWEPDGMLARQYEIKVRAGEITGFTASTNSFAAIVALTAFVTLGVLLDRFFGRRVNVGSEVAARRGDDDELDAAQAASRKQIDAIAIGFLFIVACCGAAVLLLSPSRTAQGLVALCFLAGSVAWWCRGWLSRHAKLAFALSVGLFTAGWTGVVTWGATFNSLIHPSLTFRWNYWAASWRLFLDHFLHGVGWGNFGPSYLQYRIARAAEEPRDPHNLFVRLATELGLIGLLLGTAWLMRLAWVTVRPISQHHARRDGGPRTIWVALGLAVVYGLLSITANVDLAALGGQADSSGAALYDLIKRSGFVVVAACAVAAALYSATGRRVDDRPGLLLRWGIVVGLLGFFLHGLFDYAFFDTGPMFVAAVLAGAACGINGRESTRSGRHGWILFAVGTMAWLFTITPFTFSVLKAEALAGEARGLQQLAVGGHVSNDRAPRLQAAAAARLGEAFDAAPTRNADYAVRQAEALQQSGGAPGDVLAAYNRAVAADPLGNRVQLDRARFRRRLPDAAAQRDLIDADYSAVLARNPRDLYSRLEYANWLLAMNQRDQAREQFERVLQTNDGFDAAEPKRLPAAQLSYVKGVLQALGR